MRLLPKPAGANGTELSMAIERDRIEYVGGPLDGTDGEVEGLPDELRSEGGRYVRSVRCADDGAMRYVWRDIESTRNETAEGGPTWRTGS
jgi:hypothetical protein